MTEGPLRRPFLDRPATDTPVPWREKTAAATLHALLSALAVGALVLVATRLWYPDFLFEADGGWQGLRIVVLVDLVLGPLLTFVVFRRGKRGLALDLGLVAGLQLLAFVSGAWLMWSERPIAVALSDGRFYTVSASDFSDAGMPVALPGHLPGERPWIVVIDLPEDAQAQGRLRLARLQSEQPLYLEVDRYRPLASRPEVALAAAQSWSRIAEGGDAGIQDWLAARGRPWDAQRFVPFSSRYLHGFLALSPDGREVLGLVPTPPSYRFIDNPIVIPRARPGSRPGPPNEETEGP